MAQGGGACLPRIDIDLYANGAETLTGVQAYAGVLVPITIAPGATTFNSSTNVATKAAHAYFHSTRPIQYTNSGGALPSGLELDTDYWVIPLTSNTYKIANSFANALACAPVDARHRRRQHRPKTRPIARTPRRRAKWAAAEGFIVAMKMHVPADAELTATTGYTFTIPNRPRFVAIALGGVVASGTATMTANMYPVKELAS